MAKLISSILLVVAIGGAALYSGGFIKLHAGVNAGSCEEDAEIPAATHEALGSRAMAFTQAILNQNSTEAYAMMTNEARAALPLEKFREYFGMMVQSAAPFEGPRVSHTYFLHNVGVGPDTRMVCGILTDNQWVSVAVKPGLDQGHVLVSAKARNNDWAFAFWLVPNGNSWQVQTTHMGVSTIVGLPPENLLKMAREERDSGHAFNAAMLYAGAQATTDYGPSFQLGIDQPLHEDLQKFRPPAEISGKPPFAWRMSGAEYSVSQVSIIGIDKKLGLMFMLPQKTWKENGDADKLNRAFIDGFIATHSDYSRSFSFLVARALKPDNSGGFGTVYENGKGFD